MENRNCCICHSDESRLYKIVEDYHLLQCNRCGLVYLKGTDNKTSNKTDFISDAKKDLEAKNKEKVEYWSFPNLYEKYKKVFDGFFGERLKRARKYKKDISSMFDAGCGYGFWMKYCQERGIKAEGIDISGEVIDFARNKLGLIAWPKDFISFETNKKYDLITMFDLLEHLRNPNEALIKCKNLLEKDGLLYTQMPDLIGFRIPKTHGYGLPHHLWQFNFRTLSMLLEKNGYKVDGYWKGPSGVIGAYESGENLLFKKIMWKVSSKLYLGNRLQVIATKKENGK